MMMSFISKDKVYRSMPFNMDVCLQLSSKRSWINDALVCEELTRSVPNRRATYRGKWRNLPVAIKCFYGNGARRRLKREMAGWELIHELQLKAPKVLGTFVIRDNLTNKSIGFGALFEWIVNGRAAQLKNTEVLQEVVRGLSLAHSRNIIFRDPHAGNYLQDSDYNLYLIDGDSIRRKRNVGYRARAKNLALLLAQIPELADEKFSEVLRAYWSVSESSTVSSVQRMLPKFIQSERRSLYWRFLRKTLRNSSRFMKEVIRQRTVVFVDSENQLDTLDQFITDPELLLSSGNLIKVGGSSAVGRINLGGTSMIVKKYVSKTAFQRFRRYLDPFPKWRRAWAFGHLCGLVGVPVAAPLVLVEIKGHFLEKTAYLLMRDAGHETLLDRVKSEKIGLVDIDRVASLFNLMNRGSLVHGDLKATNIAMTDIGPVLLDLDSMKISNARQGDIRRFFLNWEDSPGVFKKFADSFSNVGLYRKE